MTFGDEILTAVAALRGPLPKHLQGSPRLVEAYAEAERLDCIAFCTTHPDLPGWERLVCSQCEVIDVLDEHLAALIVALLRAREPLANLLETTQPSTGHALTLARTVNEVITR